VDALFSATRKCGHPADIAVWGDVGLGDDWKGRAVQLFGRNPVSGPYGFFKDVALCKGDFKNTVNEQPGSASVVQSITKSLNGIGYSGIGYRTSGVRAVSIAPKEGAEAIAATAENAVSGQYPLGRFLYIYVNKRPNEPLPPLEGAFLSMVLSQQGQQVVIKDGYIPLPARVVEKTLAALNKP